MKKLIIILIFLFTNSIWANSICPKPLSVGWELAKPFQFKDGNVVKGIDIDSLKLIMSDMKCDLQIQEIPWERHLKEVEKGTIDIAAGASITPERNLYANFSVPYLTEYTFFYGLKDRINKIKFKNEKELVKLNLKLGVIAGSYIGPEFEKLIKSNELIINKNMFESTNEKQLVELLLAGRIDGIVLGEYVKNLNPKIIDHPQKMNEHSTCFMFSKKSVSPQFIKEFNKSLKKLEQNKQLQEIRDFYMKDEKSKY